MAHSSPRATGGYLLLKEKQSAFRTLELDLIQRPTLDEVKASYRRLALKYHPDKLAQAQAMDPTPATEKDRILASPNASTASGCSSPTNSGPFSPQQKFLEIQRAYELVCKDVENNPHLYARSRDPSSASQSAVAGFRSPGVPAFVPSSSPQGRTDPSQPSEKGLHTPMGQRARTPTFGSASGGVSSGRNDPWTRTPSGFSSGSASASPVQSQSKTGSFSPAPSYSDFAEAAETLNEPVNNRVAASLQRIEAQWNQRAADIRAEARIQWERRMKLNEKSCRRSTVPSRPTNMTPGPTEASQTAAKRASGSPLRSSTPRPAPNAPGAVTPSPVVAPPSATETSAATVSPRRTNSPKPPGAVGRNPAVGSSARMNGMKSDQSPRQTTTTAAASNMEGAQGGATAYDLPEDEPLQQQTPTKVRSADDFSQFIDRLISLTREECEHRFHLVTQERCRRSMLNVERREMEVRAVIRAQDGHFWDRLVYTKVVEIPLTLRRPHLEVEGGVGKATLRVDNQQQQNQLGSDSAAEEASGKDDSSPSLRPHLSSWRPSPQPSLVRLSKTTSSPFRGSASTTGTASPLPVPSMQRRNSCGLSPIAPHLAAPQLQRRAYHIL
jgi:curved DNA-binding protein CbpA